MFIRIKIKISLRFIVFLGSEAWAPFLQDGHGKCRARFKIF
ncbi:hypothetical protein XaFJ1_GM001458 [Xanthomonas albilineans]|nr:hypothetical protein XaFJ1_GM001458 [Xanthomonas albilineans]